VNLVDYLTARVHRWPTSPGHQEPSVPQALERHLIRPACGAEEAILPDRPGGRASLVGAPINADFAEFVNSQRQIGYSGPVFHVNEVK